MTQKALFAFDIDGTLTHQLDSIDPGVIAALRQLTQEGFAVALLTGRMYSFAKRIFDRLDFPYLLGVQNGADLMLMPEKKQIRRHYLGKEALALVEEVYQGLPEDFLIYMGMDHGDFCYYRKDRFSEKALQYLAILAGLGCDPWKESDFDFGENFSCSLIKCFGPRAEMLILRDRIREIPSLEVSMIRDPIDPSYYLTMITHPSANKGHAILDLREVTGVPVIVAAGDQANDLKMLQAADVAIAVETGPKEILDEADILAKTPVDRGIIEAIEKAKSYT